MNQATRLLLNLFVVLSGLSKMSLKTLLLMVF